METISTAISGVTVGLDVSFQNLTMFPLLGEPEAEAADSAGSGSPSDARASAADYLMLDEALGSGWARVTEISESGSVPELRFVNNGAQPVFILDGEELVGAKQNRVVNLSLLVPAKSTLTIPVSCVEAGRWHARSRAFTAASDAVRRGPGAQDEAGHGVDDEQRRAERGAASPTRFKKSQRIDRRAEGAHKRLAPDLHQRASPRQPRPGAAAHVFAERGSSVAGAAA